jgi:hypothetical protein
VQSCDTTIFERGVLVHKGALRWVCRLEELAAVRRALDDLEAVAAASGKMPPIAISADGSEGRAETKAT